MTRRAWMRVASVPCAILAFAFWAVPVFAAENPQQEATSTAGWVYRWINFAIFVALIVWFFTRRKTRHYFSAHQNQIAEAIAESARARDEAEREEREAESKMAALETQVAEMRAQAERDSAAEAQRIRALAREEAKRVAQSAQVEIRAAERAAEMELRSIAARAAMGRAEALLRDRVNAQTESTFFEGFITELEGAAR